MGNIFYTNFININFFHNLYYGFFLNQLTLGINLNSEIK